MDLLGGRLPGTKKFYINYEECKYFTVWHISYKVLCFILTMRNVN